MPGKIPAVRRESNRKIIKPKRDLPDEQVGEKVCLGFQTLEFQILLNLSVAVIHDWSCVTITVGDIKTM